MKRSARIKRRARHQKKTKVAGLNLVSLMDIFTILVFFLLINSGNVEVLEVIVRQDSLAVNYPAGGPIKDLPLKQITLENGDTQLGHDFELLTLVLQGVKRHLSDGGIEKRDISLLSEPETDYQTIVSAMDAIRSYKTVVVADVVDAELFPDVSLGDAPEIAANATGTQL